MTKPIDKHIYVLNTFAQMYFYQNRKKKLLNYIGKLNWFIVLEQIHRALPLGAHKKIKQTNKHCC